MRSQLNDRRRRSGLSLVELIAIVAVAGLLIFFLLPVVLKSRMRASRISCVNVLKNVGLSFRTFATDNNDKFPGELFATNELQFASLTAVDVFRYASSELTGSHNLRCPMDKQRNQRSLPTNFSAIVAEDISYFVSLSAREANPATILAGDRNLESGGRAVRGQHAVTRGMALTWSKEMHGLRGYVAMADGSVQGASNATSAEIVRRQEVGTNWVLVP
jgi:competence protein ComGC